MTNEIVLSEPAHELGPVLQKAEEYVREHGDEDEMSDDELESHFASYFGRPADDSDRKNGLWSLLCQAVEK